MAVMSRERFEELVAASCDSEGDFGKSACPAEVADLIVVYVLDMLDDEHMSSVAELWEHDHPAASRRDHVSLIDMDEHTLFLFAHASLTEFRKMESRSETVQAAVEKIFSWHYPLNKRAVVYEIGLGGEFYRWAKPNGRIDREHVGKVPC